MSNAAAYVRDRLAQLRNTLGELVPTYTDDQGHERAAAPNGRLVVASGQTISSAWGNTTYDQTMQTYASAADRANQWPAPQEGSLSYLLDSHTPFIFRSGAWHALPIGFLNQASGPAAQTDYGATMTTVASLAVPVTLGRWYRFTSYLTGTQITAAGNARAVCSINDSVADHWLFNFQSAAINQIATGHGIMVYTPTATRTTTFTVSCASSATGPLRVGAGGAQLAVEDIGG